MTGHEQVTPEMRAAAAQAGVTRDTFGEWVNLARRAERAGDLEDQAECARMALSVAARFPWLGPRSEKTLAMVRRLADAPWDIPTDEER